MSRANTPRASTITIYQDGGDRLNSFTLVRDDGSTADRLCFDEMLAEVARMTMPEPTAGPRYLRSPEQMEREQDRRAARAAMFRAKTDIDLPF
jgi:hypothetical protein